MNKQKLAMVATVSNGKNKHLKYFGWSCLWSCALFGLLDCDYTQMVYFKNTIILPYNMC
jgi:hypothetical protein